MDAIVIGGGIGGLTLALALHASGAARRIRVFEAAAEMRALGIGIHIGAHAMKELSALGLEDALVATSCQPEDYAFFTRHGQLVYREPFGKAAGHQWPHITLLRPDLQRVLLDRGARADRAGEFHHRPSLHRRRAERRPRHRALRRSAGRGAAAGGRRCADRLRRHPLGGARAVLSGRGAVQVSRLQPLARHDAAEAVSHRRQHRPHRRAAFDDAHQSAAQRHRRRRQPAHQLGLRDRARRRGAGRLEQAGRGWRISSRPIRTGRSTGWTCRR